MEIRFVRFGVAGIFLSFAMLPLIAGAQESTLSAARPAQTATLLRGGTTGELFAIYVPRSEAVIETSIEFARNLSQSSTNELIEARRLSADGEGRVRILTEELRTSKTRRDVAKKSKNEGERLELEAAVKQQERELSYLKTLTESLQTNVERLESDRTAADSYVRALEIELTVARSHAGIGGSPTPAEVAAYREVLRKMLDAQRGAADNWASAGELRKRVAEKQIRQLQALDKLNAGK